MISFLGGPRQPGSAVNGQIGATWMLGVSLNAGDCRHGGDGQHRQSDGHRNPGMGVLHLLRDDRRSAWMLESLRAICLAVKLPRAGICERSGEFVGAGGSSFVVCGSALLICEYERFSTPHP
jgi:hypothetical protein